jgi:hypothetical protein
MGRAWTLDDLTERLLVWRKFRAFATMCDEIDLHCQGKPTPETCDACPGRARCERSFDEMEAVGTEIRRRKGA